MIKTYYLLFLKNLPKILRFVNDSSASDDLFRVFNSVFLILLH